MTRYTLRDHDSTETIEAADLAEAKEAAVDWALEGDWPAEALRGTYWITVWIDDATGELAAVVTVPIEPPEPPCTEAEGHEWLDRGVQVKVCRHCGCKWITDTWATDPLTGEQGLCLTRYEEA